MAKTPKPMKDGECGCVYGVNHWIKPCTKHEVEWKREHAQAQVDYRSSIEDFLKWKETND